MPMSVRLGDNVNGPLLRHPPRRRFQRMAQMTQQQHAIGPLCPPPAMTDAQGRYDFRLSLPGRADDDVADFDIVGFFDGEGDRSCHCLRRDGELGHVLADLLA